MEDTYTGELNNPLIFIDPSGHVWGWVEDLWNGFKTGVKATADFLILIGYGIEKLPLIGK